MLAPLTMQTALPLNRPPTTGIPLHVAVTEKPATGEHQAQ